MNAIVEVETVEAVSKVSEVVVFTSVSNYFITEVATPVVTSTVAVLRHSIERGAPNALSTTGGLAVA